MEVIILNYINVTRAHIRSNYIIVWLQNIEQFPGELNIRPFFQFLHW